MGERKDPVMGFAPVADSFHSHPKVLALGPDIDALALWLLTLTWSTEQMTDGLIPRTLPQHLLRDTPYQTRDRWIRGLCRVRLWDAISPQGSGDESAWEIHDFLDWQKSRKQIKEIRKDKKRAGALGGLAKSKQRATAQPGTVLQQPEKSALPTPDAMSKPDTKPIPDGSKPESTQPDAPSAGPTRTRIAHAIESNGNEPATSERWERIRGALRDEHPEWNEELLEAKASAALVAQIAAEKRAP